MVDAFTVFFLTFAIAVTVLFAAMAPLTDLLDGGPWGDRLAPTLLFLIVAIVYETAFVSLRGQTPGRDLLDLKVVGVCSSDAPSRLAAMARATGWAVVLIPDWRVTAAIVAAAAVWVVVDPRGRGPHDLFVGTTVIPYNADVEEGLIMSGASETAIDERYGPRSWRALVGLPRR